MAQGSWGPCIEQHTIAIHDRGGVRREAVLENITSVEWGRELDDQRVFKVVIAGRKNCRMQLAELLKIKPRRHEAVIFLGNNRVAEGPILEVNWYSNRVEVIAKDVTEYLDNTSLSKTWDYRAEAVPSRALMTKRIQDIVTYELTTPFVQRINTGSAARNVTVTRWEQQSVPANILPFLEVHPSTTLYTTSATDPFEMSVFEHLKSLARGGLNFTVLGRKILVWDSDFAVSQTRPLTEADFSGDLRVIEDGTELRRIVHLSASREDEVTEEVEQIGVGHAGELDSLYDDYYGPWETIVSSETEEGNDTPTQDALNSQAQRHRRGRDNPAMQIIVPSGSNIVLSDDLTIMDLVPGTLMPVQATFNLREVTQMQMLESLTVKETPTSMSINVTLAPAGPVEFVG